MATTEQIDIDALPIKVEFVAKTKRDDWNCFEWRVTIASKSGFWTTPYYCGLAHVENRKGVRGRNPYTKNTLAYEDWNNANLKPKKPSNSDILHSLTLDAQAADMNFSEWCAESGYSDDSIKALDMYKQCIMIGTMLRKHFGADTVKAIAEQIADY